MDANQPPQKKKRVISAKSLANLRPNPQHMRPQGGSEPRDYVTSDELDFLNYVLDGASKTDAARWAGLSKGISLTSLMKRPLIDQTFAEVAYSGACEYRFRGDVTKDSGRM